MKTPFFLDPRFWLALCIWTGMVTLAAYVYGASEAKQEAAIAEAGRTATALAGLAQADAKTLAGERALRKTDRESFDHYTKEHDDAKAETDRVIAGLHRDVIRLRVPIRAPRAAAPDAGGPAAAAVGQQGYAELSQDAGIFLVDLLARGDEGIRKHAEVVDRYERLRLACTAETAP